MIALWISTVLAACGGGSIGPGLAPAPPTANPTAGPAAGTLRTAIAITIPSAKKSAFAARKQPRYVSINTQSIAIAINAATPVVVNVTASSPNCSVASNGARTCTVVVAAPIGLDTFAETLYSGLNATGAVLSTGTTSETIVANAVNTVALTLDGIIASLTLAFVPSGSPAEGTPTQIPLVVNFLDASGASIIGDAPFATPITLTDSDTSGATTLSKTSLNSPEDAVGLNIAYTGAVIAPAVIGASAGSSVTAQATLTPTSSPSATAFTCPSSDSASSATIGSRTAAGETLRRMTARRGVRSAAAAATAAAGATRLVAVTYDAPTAAAHKATLGVREAALGTLVHQYTFTHAGLVTHVLAVPASKVASVEASLRAQPGVRTVGLTGTRRYAASVTAPYFPNDPYFTGFANPVAPNPGATTPPATYETGLDESFSVPGQWDMHVSRLEYAFGYSLGSSVGTKPAALGSSSVNIAVIDTGEDTTHPELQSKIKYQKCFITSADGTSQSTSNYTTDPDGHGTDVSGIAGAATNNALGFTAAGGNVGLYGYRVFPTPDDNCASDGSNDVQCGADTADIASAIDDAVAQKVNVISMSLGGGFCNSDGSDGDPVEGAAVEEALAANIIVVAAAGNASGPPLEAPACDSYPVGSVIAVGATGLSDGSPNGSSNTTGTAIAPTEYVASYSDYGSPGAAVNSASAWGIVAPGGDPAGAEDYDDLHWIENIWTSTPYMANPSDTSFEGSCVGDYPLDSGTVDCRVEIAGTSMATPHVAGAAALILSVNPAYQSPGRMRQLLCQTADDIGDANEGCGRLDVYRAMASALGDADPGPSPSP